MTETDRKLDDWLADVADADRQIAPPADFEARVMARVRLEPSQSAWTTRQVVRRVVWIGAGAALAAGMLLSLTPPRSRPAKAPVTPPAPAVAEADTTPVATPERVAEMEKATEPAARTDAPRAVRRDEARTGAARQGHLATTEPEVLDFVPLVPLSEEELLGAFQIVRVQLSRGPGGPVQADVLLGQDGMARAIRVSTRR